MVLVNHGCAAVLVAAMALAGCGAPQEQQWEKPQATAHDFQQDIAVCTKNSLIPNYMAVGIDYRVRYYCMQSKGWTLVGSLPQVVPALTE